MISKIIVYPNTKFHARMPQRKNTRKLERSFMQYPTHLSIPLLCAKDTLNIRKLDRFHKIHIHPRIARILLILRARQARQCHNRTPLQPHLCLELADLPRTRQAVHDRHRKIHQDKVKGARRCLGDVCFALERLERFEAVDCFEVAEILALSEDDEEFEVDGVVVDEEDAGAEIFGLGVVGGAQGSDGSWEGLRDRWRWHSCFVLRHWLLVWEDVAQTAMWWVGRGAWRGE